MSLASSAYSTLKSTSGNDVVRVCLHKIDNGVDQVKYNSISTLHSKMKSKLIPVKDLPDSNPELPHSVMSFINDYQTRADKEIIQKAIHILFLFSQENSGSQILEDYGAMDFFFRYKNNVKGIAILETAVDELLASLVEARENPNKSFKPAQSSQFPQTSIGTAHFRTMNESYHSFEDKENMFRASQVSENRSFANQTRDWEGTRYTNFERDNQSEYGEGRKTNFEYTREDFDITQQPRRTATLGTTNPFAGNLAGTQQQLSANFGGTQQMSGTQQMFVTGVVRPKQIVHEESEALIGLKANKEDFFPVVYVPLSESDERFLFDVTVRLKYDPKVVKKVLSEQMIDIIRDFPLESLFLQGEMLQELLILMRKSSLDVQYFLTDIYVELLKKVKSTIGSYENQYHKNQKEAQQSDEFLFTDEKEYIKNSYPSLKPPSEDFLKDPAFKKSQETFHFNYFLLVDGIIDATVDLLDNPFFSDNLSEIWKYTVEILRKYKYKSPNLIQEAAKDYLKRFTKKLQTIEGEKLFDKIELSYLLNVFYSLFRVFSVEEYQKMTDFKVNDALNILIKSIYRFVYTEKEVESILSYSEYLVPEKFVGNEQVMSLLSSVIRLRNKELDLLKINVRDFGGDYREIEGLVESLERVLKGVPYATVTNFVDLYIDAFLYTQIIDGSAGKQLYTKAREMLLELLHIPNTSLKTVIYESILEDLQGNALFIGSRERVAKKTLMFQSLLDEELLTELLFTALDNENTINSVSKIFLCFMNQITAQNRDPSQFQHFLNYAALLHHYVSHTQANPTKTSAPAGIYEVLKPVNQAISKILPQALLKNLAADLFSKEQKRRVLAFKYLSDGLFLRKLLSDTSREERLVREYEEAESKLRADDNKSTKKTEKDPIEFFLDPTLKHFVYKDNAADVEGDFGGSLEDLMKSVGNLLKIAGDRTIEYRLRLSSLEQLGEMLQWLLKSYSKPEQLLRKDILKVIEKIADLALSNLESYCKDRHKEKDTGYIGRILGLLNRIIRTNAIPGEVSWSLVGAVYDLSSSFMRENALEVIGLLMTLADQRNESVRYQALLALNYLGLFVEVSRDKLPEEYKQKTGVTSLRIFEERFFLLGEFELVDYQSHHKDFWSFLPLEEDANFFVDMHIVNAKRLGDPEFSVQDQVLEEKCITFCNNILEETSTRAGIQKAQNEILLSNVERWAKLIPTLDGYLPQRLLQINVFGYLIKVYSSSLTLSNLRNDETIERITTLVNKLLRSKSLIKEIHSNDHLLQNISEFLDFVANSLLGPLYEIQSENAREKLDIILSALSVINRMLSFTDKSNQLKLKLILTKKIIKQSFIDLLHELSTFFINNEVLFFRIGKLCKNLLKFPEIYQVLNMQPLLSNLFDFMFQCSGLDNFKNKHLAKWFLRYFLHYSLKEENSQNTVVKNFTQSLSNLSLASKEIVSKSSCFGWLLRASEDRETEIRVHVWNLLGNLVNRNIVNDYQSSVETALMVVYSPNEAYGVVANAANYINRTLDLFMNKEEEPQPRGTVGSVARSTFQQGEDSLCMEDLEGGEKRKMEKNDLLRALYRKNIISRIKSMLEGTRCPPAYLGSLVALLRNTCVLNPQKAMPVLSQLEFWDQLVELANPKVFKHKANKKKLEAWGREVIEVVMLVNNIMQLLVFGMSYDKQVAEYLIYCTQLFKVVIKWLRVTTTIQEKDWYRENPEINFLVDACSATLVQIMNLSIFLSEDKTIVIVNKLYEEKIEKESKESRYNVYLLISKLFTTTKNDLLILALFRLIANLLPKWKKGLHLVESKDLNGETLSESLILHLFGHYKLNDMVLTDNKISFDDYLEAKTTMTSCICTLLCISNAAKISFMYSGFLTYCLKNLTKAAESFLLEEGNVTQQSAASINKRKTQQDFNTSVQSITGSRFYQASIPNQSGAYEDIKSTTKILKYFFIEAAVGDFRKEELFRKLDDHISSVFDSIFRSWKLLSRKEELFEEITHALCNFASNRQINVLCLQKLTDVKSPIFADVTNTILKFEAANKQLLKTSFEFARNLAHSLEVRNMIYKAKVIENCVMKLTRIWNARKEWTLNNPLIQYVIDLFLAISFFKDSHDRILIDASLLDQLVDLSNKAQLKGKLVEKIWILFGNLAYNKSTKHFFLAYEKIFTMALSLLNLDEKSLKLKWISTQFFVNILHKCNAAIALVKKEHITDQFFYLKSEMERELDKLTFSNFEREENEQKIYMVKQLLENLSKISLFIKQV